MICSWPLIGVADRTLRAVAELVIFDCDGVLVDSDRISLRIQAEQISSLGLEMGYEDCVRDFLGLGMEATLEILTERLGRPVPEGWEAKLDAAVREGFRRELVPVSGVVERLRRSNCRPASPPAAVTRRCALPWA